MIIGKKFPKPANINWRLKKARAKYINFRQWNSDFEPDWSPAGEIELEQGGRAYIIREASNSATPDYIVTENYL